MLNELVSSWITGFRYYWGGYMSPLRHQQGLIAGEAVGNVDTNGPGSEPGVIGCDCSGCVSAWLAMPRHSTGQIGEDRDNLFDPISLDAMEPGDLFNRPGHHVRMLVNRIEGTNDTSFRIMESSTTCQGVCVQTFTEWISSEATPPLATKELWTDRRN